MTTPHGCESFCWPCLPKGKDGIDWLIDMNSNVHIYVPLILKGKKTDSRIMWTCHLDTADHAPKHVVFTRSKNKCGDEIIETDGKSILGADCKMGAAIMIKMIEAGVPGWYAFFAGEEVGRIGSKALADRVAKRKESDPSVRMPDLCISLDRMNMSDIITRQSGRECCSPTFALALASIFNKHPDMYYKPCPNGSFTDSYSFVDLIPECTNISVGYAHQHTKWEEQNMTHAENLLATILEYRDLFELLPVERDIKVKATKKKYTGTGHTNYVKDVKESKGSDPTDHKSSGGTGTQPLASRTASGATSSTSSGGKAGMDKQLSSQLVSSGTTGKQTKAERKRAKRQRRAVRKLNESADTCETGTQCLPASVKLLLPSTGETTRVKEPIDYPFVCKTELEVEQTILERPYLDCLASVRRSEIWKAEPQETLGYPEWMRDTWEFDVENEEDAASVSGSICSEGEDIFNEMQMQYEKGELDEEEEELYLMEKLEQLKRGDTRGHRHGTVIQWYECQACGLFDSCDVLDDYPDGAVYCTGCGDPIERQLMRYDGDVEMYVPITGDMSRTLDPSVVDEGRRES